MKVWVDSAKAADAPVTELVREIDCCIVSIAVGKFMSNAVHVSCVTPPHSHLSCFSAQETDSF